MIKVCNRIIEYSFYALFLLVPLVLSSATSELFEFNKMWLTFGLTIIIGASWFIKMVANKKLELQRTPLDLPILLFFLSQVLSTIFSWDIHVSLWGYYSRFNGGLLSITSYIFLYYAFVSNSPTIAKVQRLMTISLMSGLIVALWGLPSHFGYDPTCLLFRGNFDVSCWTADFQPRVRIFSTLGQPDWLSAYLAILLPISIAFLFKTKKIILNIFYIILSTLFYLDLLYSGSRSGVIAAWIALIIFLAGYIFFERKNILGVPFKKTISLHKFVLITLGIFAIFNFFQGSPIQQLNKFTFPSLKKEAKTAPVKSTGSAPSDIHVAEPGTVWHLAELGGTDSGKIRLFVWEGSLNAWKHYPIFGTGVETFAFAYYKFKPVGHNLTSEWNFLYNKAHNEFLNYLATTGIVGLGTYVLMIVYFLYLTLKRISKSELGQLPARNASQSDAGGGIRSIRNLILALLSGYVSILITNFFGFSVVITNIYLFMIPAFVFILQDSKKQEENLNNVKTQALSGIGRIYILSIIIIASYLLFTLFKFWNADKSYAYGYNLDRAGDYQRAYSYLHKAVLQRGDEPVFKDELSVNSAILAAAIINQADKSKASDDTPLAQKLAKEAIETSNLVTSQHSNNIVFWKTRTRVFYSLAQADSRYLSLALESIKKAYALAPTDANISYNLGVLYGQNDDIKKGIETLENTIKLRPNYKDAYYALGLFYHQEAIDKNGKVIDFSMQKKAIAQMHFILDHIIPNDAQALDALKTWEK